MGSWLSRMPPMRAALPGQTTVGGRRWPGVVRGPGAEALAVPGILGRCLRREKRGHWCAANGGGDGSAGIAKTTLSRPVTLCVSSRGRKRRHAASAGQGLTMIVPIMLAGWYVHR